MTFPVLCRTVLFVLIGLITFGQVLSPQYLFWALPFAALGALDRPRAAALLVVLCVILGPSFYPGWYADYHRGPCLSESVMLVARNLLLVSAWIILFCEAATSPQKEVTSQ